MGAKPGCVANVCTTIAAAKIVLCIHILISGHKQNIFAVQRAKTTLVGGVVGGGLLRTEVLRNARLLGRP